jgi:mannobiose 2-epimerase
MEKAERLLESLYTELNSEMKERILPFWMNYVFEESTFSFHGQILSDTTIIKESPRGAVLNARILWTFSAAYHQTGEALYLEYANKAFEYFTKHFIDKEHGGVYWSIAPGGEVLNNRKQIYAQAFAIYALSQYYLASGEQDAIMLASDLYYIVEEFAFDKLKNGYIEALSCEWKALDDLRLSEKDANEPKSMNTHLHLLEAYTKLYEVWKDDDLGNSLLNLINIHFDHILSQANGHFNLFFDVNWGQKSELYSFGHDIEGAWLITEAARTLGNSAVIEKAEQFAVKMAEITLTEGIATDGSLYYEGLNGSVTDSNRHWWTQAEGIIGFINAWEISRNDKFLKAAYRIWGFIKWHMQHPSGEWWWMVNEYYEPDRSLDLAGEWKCPYHNIRCCIEVIKRVEKQHQHIATEVKKA